VPSVGSKRSALTRRIPSTSSLYFYRRQHL
jgi:hypothetical protein